MATRIIGWRHAIVVLSLFAAVVMTEASAPGTMMTSAWADDDGGGDDGGDDGGGPSGASSGSDSGATSWNPFASKRKVYRKKTRRSVRRAAPRPPAVATRPAPRQPAEILGAALTDDEIDRLLAGGFRLLGDDPNVLSGGRLTRLEVPGRRGVRSGLALARRLVGDGRFAGNDSYRRPTSDRFRTAGVACGLECPIFQLTAWTETIGRCVTGRTIGVIDTAVETDHPALRAASIETQTVRRPDRDASGKDHGTAVASLIVGARDSEVIGIAPGVRLIAVDAFHRVGSNDVADTFDLIAGLHLLAARKVDVINMSLSGPDNQFLKEAVAGLVANGAVIVAAVGEPGRATGYPARYDGVVAVGSVDERLRASRRNARGEHLAFAAPGVGLIAAASAGGTTRVDGSSFAAPIVAAAYAANRRGRPRDELTEILGRAARDLGKPGRDQIYGWGLVQFTPLAGC